MYYYYTLILFHPIINLLTIGRSSSKTHSVHVIKSVKTKSCHAAPQPTPHHKCVPER